MSRSGANFLHSDCHLQLGDARLRCPKRRPRVEAAHVCHGHGARPHRAPLGPSDRGFRAADEVRAAVIRAARRLSRRGGVRTLTDGLLRPLVVLLRSVLEDAEALDHSLAPVLSALLRIREARLQEALLLRCRPSRRHDGAAGIPKRGVMRRPCRLGSRIVLPPLLHGWLYAAIALVVRLAPNVQSKTLGRPCLANDELNRTDREGI